MSLNVIFQCFMCFCFISLFLLHVFLLVSLISVCGLLEVEKRREFVMCVLYMLALSLLSVYYVVCLKWVSRKITFQRLTLFSFYALVFIDQIDSLSSLMCLWNVSPYFYLFCGCESRFKYWGSTVFVHVLYFSLCYVKAFMCLWRVLYFSLLLWL
jgi:hypothetical protein